MINMDSLSFELFTLPEYTISIMFSLSKLGNDQKLCMFIFPSEFDHLLIHIDHLHIYCSIARMGSFFGSSWVSPPDGLPNPPCLARI